MPGCGRRLRLGLLSRKAPEPGTGSKSGPFQGPFRAFRGAYRGAPHSHAQQHPLFIRGARVRCVPIKPLILKVARAFFGAAA
jgi:hypothetical protein